LDIIDNIQSVFDFTSGMDLKAFAADIKTVYAVDRCFEIIGEATRQLPEEFILQYDDIDWHKMIAFRNVLIHEYFRIERGIEWNIIQNTLPSLKEKIENLLDKI